MRTSRRGMVAAMLMAGVMTAGSSTAVTQAIPEAAARASDAHAPALKANLGERLDRVHYLESPKREHPIKSYKVSDVLGHLNRRTQTPKECTPPTSSPMGPTVTVHPDKGFCWDRADTETASWIPQGLTHGSADGHHAWAASWHHEPKPHEKSGSPQSRVTFIDSAHKKYRHVVLADPGTGKGDHFKPVNSHAGGIAWIGHYLYVADSGNGIRVFDLNHVWKTDGGKRCSHPSDPDQCYTINNGTVHAAGYDYVLPQVGSYTAEPWRDHPSEPCNKDKNPFFSSISYDRASNHLVSGEYCGSHGNANGRLVLWKVNNEDSLGRPGSTVRPAAWFFTSQTHMQGVTARDNRVISTSSKGATERGMWYPMNLAGKRNEGTLHASGGYRTAAPGPEDITFAGRRYWTLTEHQRHRYVFPNDADETVSWWP